jgi:hypothetical protein
VPDNTVEIIIKAAVEKAGEKVRSFTEKAVQQFKRMGDFVRNIGKKLFNLKSIAIGALAGWGIKRVVGEFERLAGVQEQAEATLKQAMVSMERYSEGAFEAMKEHASALQKVTTFGDEATLSGMKFLMTYKDITDDLMPRASRAMLDLAALMGGDTRQAANMLGKASMGLAGELRRVGITIDEDVAKAGDFAAILSEIEKQVGGQAEALATTDAGKIQRFGNVWGDIKEKIGAAISRIHADVAEKLLPYFEQADQWLANFLDSERWLEWARSASEAISGFVSVSITWFQDNWPIVLQSVENLITKVMSLKDVLLSGWNVLEEWGKRVKDVFKSLEPYLMRVSHGLEVIGARVNKYFGHELTAKIERNTSAFGRLSDAVNRFFGHKTGIVFDIKGRMSPVRPLSETIEIAKSKFAELHNAALAASTTVVMGSSAGGQAPSGVRTSVGLPTTSAQVARKLSFIERIRRHEAPGPAQIGTLQPVIVPLSLGISPTQEQAEVAAKAIGGVLAKEVKYGTGNFAAALKSMGL